MTGGPISNQRLVSCIDNIITFKARAGGKNRPKRQVDVKQTGVEFVRNFSIHILPKGFTKSRCYGGYSSRNRTAFIALCQALKPPPQPTQVKQPQPPAPDSFALDADEPRCPICAHCQQQDGSERRMQLTGNTFRPAWRELFYGPDHPQWFES